MVKSIWKGEEDVKLFLDKENKSIKIQGALGECVQVFQGKDILFDTNKVLIKSKSSLGYFNSRMKSLLNGVSYGYFIELQIVGRGFRFVDLVDRLLVKLGYTHYIELNSSALKGVKIVGSRNSVLIFGMDLEEVNRVGGLIRNFMVPEAYKGKGICYAGEEIKLKVGKK
jgi:large subunit ribosomal protein L6